jgi:hypothetical protein
MATDTRSLDWMTQLRQREKLREKNEKQEPNLRTLRNEHRTQQGKPSYGRKNLVLKSK